MLRKQPNSKDGPRTTRGLGYQLVDLPVASEGGTVNAQLAGHQGFNIGWVSEFGVVTEAGVGFAVSTNGNSGDGVVSDFINLLREENSQQSWQQRRHAFTVRLPGAKSSPTKRITSTRINNVWLFF